jgi:hypothetical protein
MRPPGPETTSSNDNSWRVVFDTPGTELRSMIGACAVPVAPFDVSPHQAQSLALSQTERQGDCPPHAIGTLLRGIE